MSSSGEISAPRTDKSRQNEGCDESRGQRRDTKPSRKRHRSRNRDKDQREKRSSRVKAPRKSRGREKRKRRSKHSADSSNSISSSSSSSLSTSTDDESTHERRHRKRKRDRKRKKKSRRRSKDSTKPPSVIQLKEPDGTEYTSPSHRGPTADDIALAAQAEQEKKLRQEKAKVMVPMSREQYEAEQNTIREVFDEESGRWRLIRGTGEVIERIVSQSDHARINQTATRGDGASFARNIFNATNRCKR